jgi:hypothetical protein
VTNCRIIPIRPDVDLIAPLRATRAELDIRAAAIRGLSEKIEEATDEADRVRYGHALEVVLGWDPMRGGRL